MSKLDKPITARKAITLSLICILIGAVFGAVYVYASSPSTFQVITSGIVPGAPTFTIFNDGGICYAKNLYGGIYYSAVDATTVFQNVADIGGHILITQGDYILDTITLDKNVKFEGSGNVRLIAKGNAPIFLIQLNDAWTWKTAQGYKTADIEIDKIIFIGSRITDANTAFIEIQQSSNVVNVLLQLDKLQFVDGKRGIWQNSSNVWGAMGCYWTNIRTLNMTGSSIYLQCATDLILQNFEVYNSDYEITEPNVILNSVQAGEVYGSGIVVNGLTVLSRNSGSVSHSVEIHNKAAHISNIEIDTSAGDGLYLNGTHNTITNFEISGHAGNGVIVEGNWNSFINGKIRENGENGLYFTNGGYLQLKADFINNGKSVDNTYYDLNIADANGQDCIIEMTAVASGSNRPAYGAFLGSGSYGTIKIYATNQRSGAVTQHTSKLWNIDANFNSLLYEQYGTTYVGTGLSGTKKEVALTMAFAPTIILLQGTTADSSTMSYDSSNKTSTYFLINIPTNNDFTVSWHAKYIP